MSASESDCKCSFRLLLGVLPAKRTRLRTRESDSSCTRENARGNWRDNVAPTVRLSMPRVFVVLVLRRVPVRAPEARRLTPLRMMARHIRETWRNDVRWRSRWRIRERTPDRVPQRTPDRVPQLIRGDVRARCLCAQPAALTRRWTRPCTRAHPAMCRSEVCGRNEGNGGGERMEGQDKSLVSMRL